MGYVVVEGTVATESIEPWSWRLLASFSTAPHWAAALQSSCQSLGLTAHVRGRMATRSRLELTCRPRRAH
ncbi:hypothetical protein OG285_32665 [Streptomyces sp. NBC_01471]|uniref:hypothetical protein n=1 Tax=Streptomyces sp. NBC_01471 TaxID=2903879 RepID=UPI003246DFD1